MFDLKLIRENPELFDSGWQRRGLLPQAAKIVAMDEKHRAVKTAVQDLLAKRNVASANIGKMKAKGEDTTELMREVALIKENIPQLEEDEKRLGEEVTNFLSHLPNVPDKSVPDGKSADDNVEVRRVGQPKGLNNPQDHVDIGAALGGMDFETAAKMSGTRFVLLKSGVARLERALAQMMLDAHTQDHGYTEMSVPLLVNKEALYGTGQLPKFDLDLFQTAAKEDIPIKEFGDAFKRMTTGGFYLSIAEIKNEALRERVRSTKGDFEFVADGKGFEALRFYHRKWMIPTSEVSLTNTVLDTILNADELPLRLTALTPCFRSEAGAAGKDTRGMIRQHQFYKVELVSITEEDKSMDELERMVSCAESILKRLDLPFRTVALCAGDMGFSAKKTYDIEVFLPGQNAYREISSCSSCGDFQARRMNARYKRGFSEAYSDDFKKPKYVHTLNGSGVAVGRCLIAVLENYQQPDGSVVIPDALLPYMGGLKKLEPAMKRKSGQVANA